MNLRKTLNSDKQNRLQIGGVPVTELVKIYGTPLYVYDKQYIVDMCGAFTEAIKKYGNGRVVYASKAFCCKAIHQIVTGCGLGVDVVSGGEFFTAISAGVNPKNIFFHGNNKSEEEIALAIEKKAGYIVIDNLSELEAVNRIAAANDTLVNVLIRINPSVETETHKYIQTAKQDSKFGFSIDKRDALKAVLEVTKLPQLRYSGIHCHIGSNIFDTTPYKLAVSKMTDFIAKLKNKYNIESDIINLGGGFGVYYSGDDKKLKPQDYAVYVEAIIEQLNCDIKNKGIKKPELIIEPGRSIVAEAGITLYTIGSIKEIAEIKKYIAVDGGMFDNPRVALYQAKYECCIANNFKSDKTEVVTIAGKCCESSDILIENAALPEAKKGDLLAVFSTGAYNYSMASNYNRNPVPPVVLVNKGKHQIIVKGETYDDLTKNDRILEL